MKHFVSFLFVFTALFQHVSAQEIKQTTPDYNDYIPRLKTAGYEVFTYDISSLKDDTYSLTLIIREYVNGELVSDSESNGRPATFMNRRMMEDIPEASRDKVTKEFAYDYEKGIVSLSEKITIGFSPAADSLKQMLVSLESMGSTSRGLALKPLDDQNNKNRYAYDIRPFKLEALQLGEFTPLLLVGSFWYDERYGIFRFCGEREMPADMSSPSIPMIPHYYVVGVKVRK